jgi:hypothetical protein
MSARGAGEWREPFTTDVLARICKHRADCLRTPRETRRGSHARGTHGFGDGTREVFDTRRDALATGGMFNELNALNEDTFRARESLGVSPEFFAAFEDENVRSVEFARPIQARENRAKKCDIRLKHDDKTCATESATELRDVIAQSESENDCDRAIAKINRVGERRGLRARLMLRRKRFTEIARDGRAIGGGRPLKRSARRCCDVPIRSPTRSWGRRRSQRTRKIQIPLTEGGQVSFKQRL